MHIFSTKINLKITETTEFTIRAMQAVTRQKDTTMYVRNCVRLEHISVRTNDYCAGGRGFIPCSDPNP